MTHISKWLILFASILVFNSCTTQPTAPGETADIKGRVILAKSELEMLPPYGGVTVAIEGTNFSTVSDDSGYFTFNGVPTGTYNVDYTKPGYGEVRSMSRTVVGGGSAPIYWYSNSGGAVSAPTMYQYSEVVTTLKSVEFVDTTLQGGTPNTHFFIARGSVVPDLSRPQREEGMVLFFSHSSDVSAAPGHYVGYCCGNGMYANGIYAEMSGEFTSPIIPIDTVSNAFAFFMYTNPWPSVNQIQTAGFNSGDSIYVAAYGAPLDMDLESVGDYFDPDIQQNVFTSINQTPSPVIGTVVP